MSCTFIIIPNLNPLSYRVKMETQNLIWVKMNPHLTPTTNQLTCWETINFCGTLIKRSQVRVVLAYLTSQDL